jgi:hypothetical protein
LLANCASVDKCLTLAGGVRILFRLLTQRFQLNWEEHVHPPTTQ